MSRKLNAVRKFLSDAQLVAVLRALRAQGRTAAATILLEQVEKEGVDAAFAAYAEQGPEPWDMRLTMTVKKRSPRVFLIRIGLAGGHVGDGGLWRVTFTARGAVQRLHQLEHWIC